jgi:hypothetical protein
MREDCRHFESRTYPGGEVARFCMLDLAPEAPWKCPEPCPKYEPSLVDGTFVTAALARPPVEDEPEGSPDDIEAVLDDAEAIVAHAEYDVARGVDGGQSRRWWQFRRSDRGDRGGSGRLSDR